MSTATRANMEPLFGHNLSSIRIHADPDAATAARSIDARAYTVGQDIYFGENAYAPETPEGDRLLAHEIAHTVQQAKSSAAAASSEGPPRISRAGDPHEQEARDAAALVSEGQPVGSGLLSPVGTDGVAIQRDGAIDLGDIDAPPAAPPPPPQPKSYDPPPELLLGRMPADAQIVNVDTKPLATAIFEGTHWIGNAINDTAWAGRSMLADICATHTWTGTNLIDATGGNGLIFTLPVREESYPGGFLHSTVEIKASIANVKMESADGVGISQQSGGGAGLSSSGTFSGSTTTGAEFGGGDDKSGVGKVSVSSAKGNQLAAGTTRSSALQNATATTAGVRFSFDVQWDVTVRQDYEVGTWTTILSVGGANIGHAIADDKIQKPKANGAEPISKFNVVRFPQVRCTPVF
ncbi:MAG: DUF4157 domain-containing protein [Nitrolancea sp.]